jgi:hypothetical protein
MRTGQRGSWEREGMLSERVNPADLALSVDLPGIIDDKRVVQTQALPERVLSSTAAMRGAMALAFAAIFTITVVCSFLNVGSPYWGNVKELLQILIPVEATLFAAAGGFYFGTKA